MSNQISNHLTPLEQTVFSLQQAEREKQSLENLSRRRKIATRAISCLLCPITCPVSTCICSSRFVYRIIDLEPVHDPRADRPFCTQLLDCSMNRPPQNAIENCQLALFPYPCLSTAVESLKLCDPCIGKPEDQDSLLTNFYLRPPERQPYQSCKTREKKWPVAHPLCAFP